MNNNTKIGRFINAVTNPKPTNRKGSCTSNICETLDGKKGGACCHLGCKCPALSNANCMVYKLRPLNCRVFPASKEDLKLVKNCGYYFEN